MADFSRPVIPDLNIAGIFQAAQSAKRTRMMKIDQDNRIRQQELLLDKENEYKALIQENTPQSIGKARMLFPKLAREKQVFDAAQTGIDREAGAASARLKMMAVRGMEQIGKRKLSTLNKLDAQIPQGVNLPPEFLKRMDIAHQDIIDDTSEMDGFLESIAQQGASGVIPQAEADRVIALLQEEGGSDILRQEAQQTLGILQPQKEPDPLEADALSKEALNDFVAQTRDTSITSVGEAIDNDPVLFRQLRQEAKARRFKQAEASGAKITNQIGRDEITTKTQGETEGTILKVRKKRAFINNLKMLAGVEPGQEAEAEDFEKFLSARSKVGRATLDVLSGLSRSLVPEKHRKWYDLTTQFAAIVDKSQNAEFKELIGSSRTAVEIEGLGGAVLNMDMSSSQFAGVLKVLDRERTDALEIAQDIRFNGLANPGTPEFVKKLDDGMLRRRAQHAVNMVESLVAKHGDGPETMKLIDKKMLEMKIFGADGRVMTPGQVQALVGGQ